MQSVHDYPEDEQMVDAVAVTVLSGISEPATDIFGVLFKQAELSPQKEALVFQDERYTYSELLNRAGAVAEQLSSAGVKKGDRVGLLFPNYPDYIASFFAVCGIGGTVVPINPLLKSEEIAHILADSQAETLIVHESSLDEALKAQGLHKVLKRVFVGDGDKLGEKGKAIDRVPKELTTFTLSQKKTASAAFKWSSIHANDLALLVYTSGTTGKPKGAMLTHFNLLSVFPSRLDIFDINYSDKLLAVLPMCHIYGIAVLMIGSFACGATLVMLPKFEPAPSLKIIAQEKVTIVPAVPTMYQFLLLELEKAKYDLSSVRICFCGAAPLPVEVIESVEREFGAALVEGWGMTETSCVATINPLKGTRKPGSVGLCLPGVEVIIVDDAGNRLPAGPENVGELWIKGSNVMSGYYMQDEENAKCIQDGWFATGDLGWEDEEGYLYIVGRKKEMIIRGGQNIYPREIENVISRLQGVVESAVIGVPDKFMGERVKAVIVTAAGAELSEEQVKEFCAERLAEYKVPRLVEFRSSLPKNSTGKVLKRLLV
ncbi:MAG: long-chain fatty acid--CoA ligase [Candidatus Obscuribacterales bacterium]|nr:long-chain fatty acid--CoA ligase [Candidatus Obscuribacterales bacterium]